MGRSATPGIPRTLASLVRAPFALRKGQPRGNEPPESFAALHSRPPFAPLRCAKRGGIGVCV